MWDALQTQSFVVGAALVLIYQAARFGDIYTLRTPLPAATFPYFLAPAFAILRGRVPTTGRSSRSLSRASSSIHCCA